MPSSRLPSAPWSIVPVMLLSLAVIGLVLLTPSRAHAAAGFGYSVQNFTGCDGGYNSGRWDNAGELFIPCGSPSTIHELNPDGSLERAIPLSYWVTDAAPSLDGSKLYLATQAGAIHRLVRQSDGSWAEDAGFHLANYTFQGQSYRPEGESIALDAVGDLFVADGGWTDNGTNTVIEYNPAGAVVTTFGSKVVNSWALGDFYWMLNGISVSQDGQHVYTTEVGNNRVQRWDRGAAGSFTAAWSLGGTAANNADRGGYCAFGSWYGAFAAPYAVQFDQAGYMYVDNTTCRQVLKFTAAGTYVGDADISVAQASYPRPHGFAVAADGTVYIGETGKWLRRTDVAYAATAGDGAIATAAAGTPIAAATPAASTAGAGTAVAAGSSATGTFSGLAPTAGALLKASFGHPLLRLSGVASLPVSCSADCTLISSVTVRIKGRTLVLGTAKQRLRHGGVSAVRVRLAKSRLRTWQHATHAGAVTLALRVVDASGSVTAHSYRLAG